MDLDAYVAAHHGEWDRLRLLGRRSKLNGAEADELLDLYQRVATHLSQVRSGAPDPAVIQYLSTLLAQARTAALGRRTASWSSVADFVLRNFPATLYRARHWWISTAAASLTVALIIGVWVARNPQVQSSFLSPAQTRQLVSHDFAGYYSEYGGTDFATHVWTNNALIAGLCIAFGVLGVPIVVILWNNMVNVAVLGGVMAANGRSGEFFSFILPHGILELTAVFVAAGAGLRLFWSWVEPGPRRRADALAHEARATVTIAIGLIGVLLVSGCIEAFVTPSHLPVWARIGIGVLAEVAFLTYVFLPGRRATLAGVTGDVGEIDQSAVAPTAG